MVRVLYCESVVKKGMSPVEFVVGGGAPSSKGFPFSHRITQNMLAEMLPSAYSDNRVVSPTGWSLTLSILVLASFSIRRPIDFQVAVRTGALEPRLKYPTKQSILLTGTLVIVVLLIYQKRIVWLMVRLFWDHFQSWRRLEEWSVNC